MSKKNKNKNNNQKNSQLSAKEKAKAIFQQMMSDKEKNEAISIIEQVEQHREQVEEECNHKIEEANSFMDDAKNEAAAEAKKITDQAEEDAKLITIF